jgi:hypothetical protein
MALCSLVGRLSYKHLCNTDLDDWMVKAWRPLLGYTPSLSCLEHGWLYFHFLSLEDSTTILEHLWTFDGSSLMLKRWRVCFDPSQDYLRLIHLWVLLPGLHSIFGMRRLSRPLATPLVDISILILRLTRVRS